MNPGRPARVPGGDMGIRTPDLLHAMQTLYQLSYVPENDVPARWQGSEGGLSAVPPSCEARDAMMHP